MSELFYTPYLHEAVERLKKCKNNTDTRYVLGCFALDVAHDSSVRLEVENFVFDERVQATISPEIA